MTSYNYIDPDTFGGLQSNTGTNSNGGFLSWNPAALTSGTNALSIGGSFPRTDYSLGSARGLSANTLGSNGLGIKTGLAGATPLGLGKTGGFFGNGNGLGFNLDTANFAMNGLTGIMNLYGGYTQAKAIKAAQQNLEDQFKMAKGAYDMNIDKKARAAANFNGYGVAGMDAAGTNALNRWGSKAILGKTNLSPATSATASARRNPDEPATA